MRSFEQPVQVWQAERRQEWEGRGGLPRRLQRSGSPGIL